MAALEAAALVATARLLPEEAAAVDAELPDAATPPKGDVLACEPFWTDLPVAGSKKTLGSFAGSWAWTKPLSSAFLGAFWQKTELRCVGGFVVKS